MKCDQVMKYWRVVSSIFVYLFQGNLMFLVTHINHTSDGSYLSAYLMLQYSTSFQHVINDCVWKWHSYHVILGPACHRRKLTKSTDIDYFDPNNGLAPLSEIGINIKWFSPNTEIRINIYWFLFKYMNPTISSARWRHFSRPQYVIVCVGWYEIWDISPITVSITIAGSSATISMHGIWYHLVNLNLRLSVLNQFVKGVIILLRTTRGGESCYDLAHSTCIVLCRTDVLFVNLNNWLDPQISWDSIHKVARSREVSKPRDSGLHFSNRSDIQQTIALSRCLSNLIVIQSL